MLSCPNKCEQKRLLYETEKGEKIEFMGQMYMQ